MPVPNLEEMVRRVKESQLTHRRLLYYLEEANFDEKYSLLTQEQKESFLHCLSTGRYDAALKFFYDFDPDDYRTWNVKDLRTKARNMGITYYTTMLKHELVNSIRAKEKADNEKATTETVPGSDPNSGPVDTGHVQGSGNTLPVQPGERSADCAA